MRISVQSSGYVGLVAGTAWAPMSTFIGRGLGADKRIGYLPLPWRRLLRLVQLLVTRANVAPRNAEGAIVRGS